jgi:ribonucleoside-diphosphate reductase beta chain
VWQYFENIHSISYTHIIENLYPDPKVVFDDILVNPQIRKRGMTVCREYNRLADITSPTKEDIYRLLLSVNILEGIRFYISFACSFAFADQGQMEKSAIILTKIAQDENMHLQTSQFLLNQLPLEDAEWAEVAKTNREWAIDQFEVAVHEELEWSEYLFQFGPRLGLNHKITTQWMRYLGNIRLGALGLPKVFSDVPNHPIPWINPWLNSKANQPPAQETQLSAYLEGGGIAQGRVAQEDMEL